MSHDVFDVRALLPDVDDFPPALYVSPEVGDPAADLLPLLAFLGLPPVALSVDEGLASMPLHPARGEQWRISIGPGGEVEVRCPDPDGGDLSFVTGITITDPAPWCDEAIRQKRALMFVGPPLPWTRGRTGLSQVLSMLGRRSACAGVIPAHRARAGGR
ncbi:hypothetical protein AB0F88_16810 [Streptosporangium sp. NPDC023963]|uniref:hypothetical protein n=1 Tax=Streptosporangium sp. NPDC023963 TaxID=3155608 RepID=UPI0034336003